MFLRDLFDRWERYERTPGSDAEDVLFLLLHLHLDKNPNSDGKDFAAIVEKVMWCGGVQARGEYLQGELFKITSETDSLRTDSDRSAEVALGYVIDAFRASSTEERLAWTYVVDATAWFHFARACWVECERVANKVRKMSEARHTETRQMRAEALDWYRKNRDSGMTKMTKDAAAEFIAKNVVPMKFRTVRDWLTEVRD